MDAAFALTLRGEEEEEERDLINDLKRYGRLAVAWNRHGSPVPRRTLTRYGPDDIPTLLALHSTGYPTPIEGEGSTMKRTHPQRGGGGSYAGRALTWFFAC